MRFASSFSTKKQLQAAVDEACGAVVDEIDSPIDIAFVFFSFDHVLESKTAGISIDQMARDIADRLGTDNIVGCCGESVIANQYEFQWQPALAIWAGSLGGSARVELCHLEYRTLNNDAAFLGWTDALANQWPEQSTLFTLSDPFSFPMDVFLQRINEDHPGTSVFGGMASGVSQPGESKLVLGGRIHNSGAVLVRITGDIEIESVVSQGCRPIGTPLVITKCERNEIHELGGVPALQQLQKIFQQLPTREQNMVNQGLHVGRVISEYIDKPLQGDFLIRNVVQIDEQTGVIAIADYVRVGQTIQFQIRDHESAHAELKQLLSKAVAQGNSHAALMFSCNGRGTRMFPGEHHDAGLLREVAGQIPAAGFFAAGEVGPIGGKNFVHGFTCSVALFKRRG